MTPTTQIPRGTRAAAALSGLLAGAAGLVAGEGLAALAGGVTGPVVAVGNRAVDQTPRVVKEWAIETFGSADKLVLIGGVLGAVALATLLLGLLGARRSRRPVAMIGLGLIVAVGGAAMLTDRAATAGAPLRLVVIAAMALVALGGFWWLLATLTPRDEHGQPAGFDRRRFLLAASALAATGAAGGVLRQAVGGSAAPAARSALDLPAPAKAAPALPNGVSFEVDGLTPYLTPNADFYRVDTALQVPQVSLDDYVLRIHGMVDQELELTFADLLDRELVERRITMTCVSNPVGGDLVGNARWLGVPMRDLLAEAGVQDGADAVRSTSTDGFTAGTPLGVLTDDRGALLALGMNGEPLPLEHGYPVRMVTPGLYGYVSATKWLIDLEVTRFADFTAYWTDRGYSAEAPIKLSSRIDVPGSFAQLEAGTNVVAGVAWAQTVGIERVEVRVGDGEWQQAELGVQDNESTWRPWRLSWDADPGQHRIEVRATDRAGTTQTSRREPIAPDGSTGWHNVTVTVA